MRFVLPIRRAAIVGLILPLAVLAESASLLKATPSSLSLENRRANADDLSRMSNLAMVRQFVRENLLVRVPSRTRHYYVRGIPPSRSYLRPWTNCSWTD